MKRFSRFLRETPRSDKMNLDAIAKLQLHSPSQDEQIHRALKTVNKAIFRKPDTAFRDPQDFGMNALKTLYGNGMNLSKIRKVLDVGSNSGYFCAISWSLLDQKSEIFGLERCQDKVDRSNQNLEK